MTNGSNRKLTLSVVHGGMNEIDNLKDEWIDLARSSHSPSIVRSHSWCRIGFEQISLDPAYSFCALVVRSGNLLVGLWPFLVRTEGSITRATILSGGGCEEYGSPLFRAGWNEREISNILLSSIDKIADCLVLHNMPEGHHLTETIVRQKIKVQSDRIPAPYIDYSSFLSFSDYSLSLSKALRSDANYQLRRLEKIGVRFELIDNGRTMIDALEWIICRKQEWVKENRKNVSGPNGKWLMSGAALKFFLKASCVEHDVGEVGVFALRTKDDFVAAAICLIDRDNVEYYITTFDHEFSSYSPGKVLVLKISSWAFENGRNFDFRITAAGYKDSWANAERQVVSAIMAGTIWGLLPVWQAKAAKLKRRLRRLVAEILPRQLVEKLKARAA